MTDELGTIKMWTCDKYHLRMAADGADEFCAKRVEKAVQDDNPLLERCRNCKRGAVMYSLGKHKDCSRKGAKVAKGETIQAKTETNVTKGETTVATERTIMKNCETHGEFTTGSNRGVCPKCKEKKETGQAVSHEGTKRTKKSSRALAPRSSSALASAQSPLSGLDSGGGAISISIDLARFPKLHSRLVMMGLNTMLAELETKA